MNTKQNKEQDIDKLNSFLRGEISAVETYNQAIEKLEDEPAVMQQLQNLRDSHAARVQQLSSQIRTLGGTPDDSSGMWGGFAKLVEGGAKMFGKSAAISALEEGEDHGKRLYSDNVDELSPDLRSFIRSQIMPEQQRTHDALSALQHRV
ncbi:MAG: DUF2383 domain-containing protein [Enhygromyxa sp.]